MATNAFTIQGPTLFVFTHPSSTVYCFHSENLKLIVWISNFDVETEIVTETAVLHKH